MFKFWNFNCALISWKILKNPNPVSSSFASLHSLMPKPFYAQIFNKIWLNWNTCNSFSNLTIQKFSFQTKISNSEILTQLSTHENNNDVFYQWSMIKTPRENLFLREIYYFFKKNTDNMPFQCMLLPIACSP